MDAGRTFTPGIYSTIRSLSLGITIFLGNCAAQKQTNQQLDQMFWTNSTYYISQTDSYLHDKHEYIYHFTKDQIHKIGMENGHLREWSVDVKDVICKSAGYYIYHTEDLNAAYHVDKRNNMIKICRSKMTDQNRFNSDKLIHTAIKEVESRYDLKDYKLVVIAN